MFSNYPFWTKSVKSDFAATTPSVWVPSALITDMGIYVRMGTYYNQHYNYQPYYAPSHYHHPVALESQSSMKSSKFVEFVKQKESTTSDGGVCELSRKIRRVRHNKIKYRICYEEDKDRTATRDMADGEEILEICEKDFLVTPSQPKKKWLKHYMNGNSFVY